MIVDYTKVDHIYIVCGKTDMRKSIDGLAAIVQGQFNLNVFDNCIFLFCGGSRNKYKALFWDGDGFMLLYKRIEGGKIQWPRSNREVRDIRSTRVEMVTRRPTDRPTKSHTKR